jgi:hypothetical protein
MVVSMPTHVFAQIQEMEATALQPTFKSSVDVVELFRNVPVDEVRYTDYQFSKGFRAIRKFSTEDEARAQLRELRPGQRNMEEHKQSKRPWWVYAKSKQDFFDTED